MNDSNVFLHTSNRMEDLAAMLAGELDDSASGDPLAPVSVVVQSRGMGRWVSLQLADVHGICLNVRFPFPREAIETILSALLPDWRPSPAFKREAMLWKIWRLLEKYRQHPAFSPISRYLLADPEADSSSPDPMKRIQLAERLATLFDHYLVYRFDTLLEWENEENNDDWQGILWREIAAGANDAVHFGHGAARLREWEQEDRALSLAGPLPSRLFLFGISSLPPLFLEIFRQYGRCREVHLFLLQPTPEYWGDFVTRKKKARAAAGKDRPGSAPAPATSGAVYLEIGHPLLPSMGRQGQDLLNLAIDFNFQQRDDDQRFTPPSRNSLLHHLQADILDLADREGSRDGETTPAKIEIDSNDTSLQVHSCHSPMREAEVLHDRLLDLFENNPDLRPRDVLVMIPNVEDYAPYIEAVFPGPPGSHTQIPFSIVDRRPRSACRVIDAWFRLLHLADSRFPARAVIDLLESPPFRRRFGLEERDAALLRAWVRDSGIRWGIDAAHREEQGMPGLSETTWRAGLEQWLLGYTMLPASNENRNREKRVSYDNVFPFGEIEGSNTGPLNVFLGAVDFLFRARRRLSRPRSLHAWADELGALLEEAFGSIDEFFQEIAVIRSALASLRSAADFAGPENTATLDAVRHYLEKNIDDTVSSGSFLSGGVTFCTLQPMRTIPAKVICLLGMNDTAFPRSPQQLGFDRMREERRPGDRSVREDDRYLFLETLLSARETLYLSFTGQSPRDLSESPPSVLVNELLDHLDRSCSFPDEATAWQFLVRNHRLQPFHPAYFGDGPLFSYSQENLEACRQLAGTGHGIPPFIPRKIDAPETEWKSLPLGQLVRFFRNPSEFFLRQRVGLSLPAEEEILEESERFSLGNLEEYALKAEAVRDRLEGKQDHDWRYFQARGKAPLGSPGLAACRVVEEKAKRFAAKVAELEGSHHPEYLPFDRKLDGFHLTGELGPYFTNNLVVSRPAKIKPKDCVTAWIQHLAANALSNGATSTILIGEDKQVMLPPRPDAMDRLHRLLQWYWQGLQEPLPFFPGAAYEFAAQTLKENRKTEPIEAARRKFTGDPDSPFGERGEIEDPYVALCSRGKDIEEILNNTFEAIAIEIFSEIDRLENPQS